MEMSIMSQFPAVSPLDGALHRPLPNAFSALRSEDFIRIIFTELSNQDPFAPNDSAALLEQLNSIRSIESDLQLVERLESLVFENKLASAANLIGRHVEGLSRDLARISGTVVSVLRLSDSVMLQLDGGDLLRLENVGRIDSGGLP
jgi:flagellar hook assembly protein FlgD